MDSNLVNQQKIVATSKDTVFSLRIGDNPSHGFPKSNDSDNLDISDFNFLPSNFTSDGYGASAEPEPSSFILHVFGILALAGFASWRKLR